MYRIYVCIITMLHNSKFKFLAQSNSIENPNPILFTVTCQKWVRVILGALALDFTNKVILFREWVNMSSKGSLKMKRKGLQVYTYKM